MAAVFAGAGSVTAMAETADAATVETQAESQAAKPAPTEFAHITSCEVTGGNQVSIKGQMEGSWSDPAYYDNYLYLFEMKPYQRDLKGRTDYAAWITKGDELSFQLPLNHGTQEDRLYSSFVVAVYDGSEYTIVSNEAYVANPESVAKYTDPYKTAQTKKGLLIQLDMLGDALNLGVKHTTVNIPYHQLVGGNLKYKYNGKTYNFNGDLIKDYDKMISAFSAKGIVVTAILLNGWNDSYPELHEAGLAKRKEAFYYGFNVSTEQGYETTRALLSFMAERYSGAHDDYGRVSNWIVGNEINNNLNWNYTGPMDIDSYTKLYSKVFRVAYTAIKSQSRNARVFFSTDYEWKRANSNLMYGAKDFIDRFNADIRDEGNIEWGLAYHPYPHPMTEPEFWDDDQTGAVNNTEDSPVVNFKNLNVLTDYFQKDIMRDAGGNVRHIILSEEGFTSKSATRGDVYDIQAAAFAYSYYIVDSNPYIDAYILSRQVDAPSEVRAGLSFGLWSCDMNQGNEIVAVKDRKLWRVFHDIDQKRYTLETSNFAKSIIGINKWSDVIPNFRWKSLEQ